MWLAADLAGIIIWCLVLWGIVMLARSLMTASQGHAISFAR